MQQPGGSQTAAPLSGLDGLLDELALVIQHTESYDR
jgi:hypothetical protein